MGTLLNCQEGTTRKAGDEFKSKKEQLWKKTNESSCYAGTFKINRTAV